MSFLRHYYYRPGGDANSAAALKKAFHVATFGVSVNRLLPPRFFFLVSIQYRFRKSQHGQYCQLHVPISAMQKISFGANK
ncbi:MAG: hypothetical protein WCO89_11445, partial [Syntrophus sp. (in: bacteria)]